MGSANKAVEWQDSYSTFALLGPGGESKRSAKKYIVRKKRRQVVLSQEPWKRWGPWVSMVVRGGGGDVGRQGKRKQGESAREKPQRPQKKSKSSVTCPCLSGARVKVSR